MPRHQLLKLISASVAQALVAMSGATLHTLLPGEALAADWRVIASSLSSAPTPRRQAGVIVDQQGDRLVVAGGEAADQFTWTLDPAGDGTWTRLPATVPDETRGVVRAIYDSQDRWMILLAPSMNVYRLDLANPAAWTQLSPQGPIPPPRDYPAVAYDKARNRLLVFGGGPAFGILSDAWALSLGDTPVWEQLQPSGVSGPSPRWASTAIYDEAGDRLVIATGSGSDGLLKSDVWALPLASPSGWVEMHPGGTSPHERYLSAAAYAPGANALVLFAGQGTVGGGFELNDTWTLTLSDPPTWIQDDPQGPLPAPRWSHALVYRETQPEVISYGGWDGTNYRADIWGLAEPPTTSLPVIQGFSPLGGVAGDEVVVRGFNLADPTEVRFGGVLANVISSSVTSLRAAIPSGATSGPITVTNEFGTGTSPRDFFIGERPQITFFSPDSGRAGETLEIHGSGLVSAVKVAIGGTGNARIVSANDTLVSVVVDTLATTGPIRVTTLVGSTLSAIPFLLIADDPRPHLLSVRDVRGDQGGKVLLRWRASDFDQQRYKVITGYRVWRRAPLTDGRSSARAAPPAGSLGPGSPSAGAPDVFWEDIAEVAAAFLKGYAYAAPTLSDSSDAGNPFTAFFVQAITADPFTFYNSSPDSGYSVDNLAPPAPSPLTVRYGPTANVLHWHGVSLADLREYVIYRGNSSEFAPSAGNLIGSTADTAFTDIAGAHSYKLAAVDVHGNRSRYVSASPDVPVGTLTSFVRFERMPGRLRLFWYSGGNLGMQAHVYRRTEGTDWNLLGLITVDGTGSLIYEDASIDDAVRYVYRLGILDELGEETFTAETSIEPRGSTRLAIGLGSNPSVGGRVRIELATASRGRATVRLFDLAGREVERQAGDAGGDGRVAFELGSGAGLRAGLYIVRAESGGATAVRRVAVLR